MYVNGSRVTYFPSLGAKKISKEITKLISSRNIITNAFRIQAYDLIMCGYFYIGSIGIMFKDKSLHESLFSPIR